MYEQNKTLILKSQAGDEKALEKLIQENNGLIWSMVRRFWYREMEPEDLYQIACIGFIKAVRRFDFEFHVELSTYAVQYIVGEIKKFLRDDGMIKISRNIKELAVKIKNLRKMYGDYLKLFQIAQMLGVTEEEVCMAIEAGKKVESINQYIYEDGNCQIQEKIVVDHDEEKMIDKLLISDLMQSLKIRDREIIELRYFKEKTQTQVASMMGISQVQVSRIERRALKKLKEELMQGDQDIGKEAMV